MLRWDLELHLILYTNGQSRHGRFLVSVFVRKKMILSTSCLKLLSHWCAYYFYNGEETWIDCGQKNIDHRSAFPGRRPSVTVALTFSWIKSGASRGLTKVQKKWKNYLETWLKRRNREGAWNLEIPSSRRIYDWVLQRIMNKQKRIVFDDSVCGIFSHDNFSKSIRSLQWKMSSYL